MAGERRIGIVGGGFIGRIHSWALYALTKGGVVDAAVTHVFDLDSAVATELARPHDAEVVADLGALLEAVDTVWICTPTAAHLAVARAAASRATARWPTSSRPSRIKWAWCYAPRPCSASCTTPSPPGGTGG